MFGIARHLSLISVSAAVLVGTSCAAGAYEPPPPGNPAAVLCYSLAADPDDPQTNAVYAGVATGSISRAAVAACAIASQSEPDNYQIGYLLGRAQFDEGNLEAAKAAFESAALAGYGSAERALGDLYWSGKGVERSEQIAFEHYERAADLGEPAGLIGAIRRKIDSGTDAAELLDAIENAGLNGAADAWNILGGLSIAGPEGPVADDVELALMRGFAAEIAEAGVELGRLYDRRGDDTAALEIYGRLVAADNADAMWEMSRHMTGEVAEEWVEAAAARGQPSAMYAMAAGYRDGAGGRAADREAYLEWLQKAAEADELEAIVEIATVRLGERPANYAEAGAWFQKAAAREDVRAYLGLAHILERGYEGVKPDAAAAYEWYSRAIAAGERTEAYFRRARLLDRAGDSQSIDKAAADLMAAGAGGPVAASARAGFREFTRETRAAVQQLLAAAGHYTGKVDGVFGPKAIAAFDAHLAGQD